MKNKNSRQLLLGIDGGATKTVALIADLEGEILARGETGGTSCVDTGVNFETARNNLEKAVETAINKLKTSHLSVCAACFGFAGNDTPKCQKNYEELAKESKIKKLTKDAKVLVCNDSKIALFSGISKDWGIIIIAGTGSNCFGINPEGKEEKSGGWHCLISDEGSAFELGINALKAVVRAFDGRGKKTILTELLLKKTGRKDIYGLIDWVYEEGFKKEKFASLGPVVSEAFKKKDEVAVKIVGEAVLGLSKMVEAVMRKLNFKDLEFEVVLIGGVFNIGEKFVKMLEKEIKKFAPKAELVRPKVEPAVGAIRLAKRLI